MTARVVHVTTYRELHEHYALPSSLTARSMISNLRLCSILIRKKLRHLPEADRAEAVTRAWRVLKGGGTCAAALYHAFNPIISAQSHSEINA